MTLPERLVGPITVGVAGTSEGTPVSHRLHALEVRVEPRSGSFLRGDCNQDGRVCGGVTDLISIVLRCFQGAPEFPCRDACDANDDGTVCGSVSDVVYLANFCFLGSAPPPAAPTGTCGVDPTEDGLDCQAAMCGRRGPSDLIYLGENSSGHEEFLRTRDSMVFVRAPGGSTEQGDHYGDRGKDELPVHPVIVSPFLIGKFEVTNAQYRRFLEAIGCQGLGCRTGETTYDYTGHMGREPYDGCHYPEGTARAQWARNDSYFEDPEFADYPVIWVDWYDAVAYGRWASGKRSRNWLDPDVYGLPTEAQWEFAARWQGEGLKPSRYPWGGSGGSMDDPANINAKICNYGQNVGRTVAVCSYPGGRSAIGLYHQAGNVYEWTADWYDAVFYSRAPLRDPFAQDGDFFRQLRGGGWFGPPFSVRGAYRCNFPQHQPAMDVGLRCAIPVSP